MLEPWCGAEIITGHGVTVECTAVPHGGTGQWHAIYDEGEVVLAWPPDGKEPDQVSDESIRRHLADAEAARRVLTRISGPGLTPEEMGERLQQIFCDLRDGRIDEPEAVERIKEAIGASARGAEQYVAEWAERDA
jgi:hypothetical protein